MSRLDDELKLAFRREEPSGDFTDKVLARITTAAPPRPAAQGWRLLGAVTTAFTFPRLRWAAAGALALILAAIAAVQFFGPGRFGVTPDETPIAEAPLPPAGSNGSDPEVEREVQPAEELQQQPARQPRAKQNPRPKQAGSNDPVTARSEGEIAKEQLMLALHIASTKLNQAQRVVRGEDTSKTEYKP
jgi:hypothetical protein